MFNITSDDINEYRKRFILETFGYLDENRIPILVDIMDKCLEDDRKSVVLIGYIYLSIARDPEFMKAPINYEYRKGAMARLVDHLHNTEADALDSEFEELGGTEASFELARHHYTMILVDFSQS